MFKSRAKTSLDGNIDSVIKNDANQKEDTFYARLHYLEKPSVDSLIYRSKIRLPC
jgi:hypothetical protein